MSEEWVRLSEVMNLQNGTNFLIPFQKLCKKYGRAYKEYIRVAYEVNETMSNAEFCFMNHLPEELLLKWTITDKKDKK